MYFTSCALILGVRLLTILTHPLKRNLNRHLDTPHKDEKKMDTQKTNEKTRLMFTLQYSLERYQAMGNGPKCQEIQRELNALKRGTKNA